MKISSSPKFLLIIALCVGAASFTSCSDMFKGKTPEGTVEYEVTYPGMTSNTMGLPDKCTYHFKKKAASPNSAG